MPKRKDSKRKPPQLNYTAPKPKRPILWMHIMPGLALLRFRPQLREGKVAAMARRIKNASACIVAPVYSAVEDFDHWSPGLVENIFQIASEVHRITQQQLKLRWNSSYPIQCVCPTFHVNRNQVSILVRPCQIPSPLHGGVTSSIEPDQLTAMEGLLNANHGLAIQCGGKTNSYWKDKGKYYALVPEGFGSTGNYTPSLLRADDLKTLLEQSLALEHGACDLYSIKVLDNQPVPLSIEKDFALPEINESDLRIGAAETPGPDTDAPEPNESRASQQAAAKKKDKKKSEEPEPVDAINPDMIISFSEDYKAIDDTGGILTGNAYVNQPERILHTVIAAAVFLHHLPANLWTKPIIKDIVALGKRIFYQSEDLLENEDWMDRVYFPIKFARRNFLADFDKIVFGKVTSTDPEVLSVERGLFKFFQGNDVGLIIGPQLVLVWQMKNNYFMFDPKERDVLGRKWTRMYSAELEESSSSGSACITWFHSLKKLSEVYTDTIALKHRKDPYRIVKLRVFEAGAKSEPEGDWMGMAPEKWIMVGTKTICDYSFADDRLRGGKALCVGIAALLRANELPEIDWTTAVIDSILAEGMELFKQSTVGLPPEQTFTVNSVRKLVDIGGRRVRLFIVDCMIRGLMLAEQPDAKEATKTGVVLRDGLNEFFNSTRFGLFTVKSVALAVWRGRDNFYYLFYPYEKLLGLPPHCLCANDASLPPMGLANTMRFKSLEGMLDFLTCSLNTKENDEYCLNPVDLFLSATGGRPPLREYEEFGESGGILRPYKSLHEGHEMFGVRADKQTLANLLIAIGFNRLTPATHWTKEEIADILHIGDKIFCKIFMALAECQARDYALQWEDIVPVIGMNKFTFAREPIVGVMEVTPEPMGEEMEEEPEVVEVEDEEGVEQQDDELYVRPRGSLLEDPLSKDLKGILIAWDAKKREFTEAVVETDFFAVAIWKKDDLYFVFDPKASGANGELTERRFEIGKDRAAGEVQSLPAPPPAEPSAQESGDKPLLLEKRSYNYFDNQGSAYTAWFSNFDEFFEHLLNKIPEEYRHDKFTLHDLTITNTAVGADDVAIPPKTGFRPITQQHSMLRGSMTLRHPSLTNSGKSEFTNCLVALAFARITPSTKMTTTLLDVILKYGDRLYSKSMGSLKATDKEKFCTTDKLRLDDISPAFSIYKIKFKWKVATESGGNFLATDVKKATGKMGSIEQGTAALLVHKGYLMAFWRSEGAFFLYDPFETNPAGVLAENGLPSLSRFPKLDNLLGYMLQKFLCVNGPNTFTCYIIQIRSSPVEEIQLDAVGAEEDAERTVLLSHIPSFQKSFQPFMANMRILRSAMEGEFAPEHGLALAALVHSRLQFVGLWGPNIGSRISFLSKYLVQRTGCDMALEAPTFDDIRRSFAVDNDILCHIVFAKNAQGPLYSTKRTEIVGVNLKNALIKFFRSCQHVIVTVPGTAAAFAVWKENGKFYLFGVDRAENELYVVESAVLELLFEPLFKNLSGEPDANNWYELRSVSVTTVPIRESICKPLTKSRRNTDADDPLHTKSAAHKSLESKEAHFYDHIADRPEAANEKLAASEFVRVGKNVDLLYSKGLLKTHRFYGSKDFFPSLQAACVEAAALSQVKSPRLWTKKTLDKLLTAGISLYINTVAVRGVSDIKMVDFRGNLFVGDFELEVCPLAPTVQAASKDNLMMCLTWVLRKYQTAYLYTDNFCFTLMLDNNDCYLYHPGSMVVLCGDIRSDSSCLIRFCTISEILDKLLTNGEISLCENVCIGPICVFKQS